MCYNVDIITSPFFTFRSTTRTQKFETSRPKPFERNIASLWSQLLSRRVFKLTSLSAMWHIFETQSLAMITVEIYTNNRRAVLLLLSLASERTTENPAFLEISGSRAWRAGMTRGHVGSAAGVGVSRFGSYNGCSDRNRTATACRGFFAFPRGLLSRGRVSRVSILESSDCERGMIVF